MKLKLLLLVLLVSVLTSGYGFASAEDTLPFAVKILIKQKNGAAVEGEALKFSQAGNHFLANLAYGEAFLIKGELDQADAYFKKALELNPIGMEGKIGLARVLAARRQAPQAMQLLREALRTSPHPERLYYELGLIREASGDIKGATQAFEQGLERYFSKK
jgi:tetratricopeptide (TPR) repeat protein